MRRYPIFLTCLVFSLACRPIPPQSETKVTSGLTYQGWSDAVELTNGLVTVTVVPSVGRILDFRLAHRASGPFWRYEPDLGKPVDPGDSWRNFGGDKTWPAPQSRWPEFWPRSWPPPVVFDQTALKVSTTAQSIVLESPVDQVSGIATRREIRLLPGQKRMEVKTGFLKKEGAPFSVGIWTITQLQHPDVMEIPLPKQSIFPNRYHILSKDGSGVSIADNTLRWNRLPDQARKIGCDAESMIWKKGDQSLTISLQREANATYPDGGCSVEIYTNDAAKAYVELECLGPLRELKLGDESWLTVQYELR
jgi:hypothetical protein